MGCQKTVLENMNFLGFVFLWSVVKFVNLRGNYADDAVHGSY